MGGCSVIGCKNRVGRSGKHFYRYPKDYRRAIWTQFARRGQEYVVKPSCVICGVHFVESDFVVKKSRLCITKNAVPTVLYRETEIGVEKVCVPYDHDSKTYCGLEELSILRGSISIEDEIAMNNIKEQKLAELKLMCRFCYESCDNSKCIPLKNLENYSIDIEEMMKILLLQVDNQKLLSELVCESCFQQIVSIDAFRRKCRDGQTAMFNELQKIEENITNLMNMKDDKPWYKSKIGYSNSQIIEVPIVEEHLEEEYVYQFVEEFSETETAGDSLSGNDMNVIEDKVPKAIENKFVDEMVTKTETQDLYEGLSTDDIIKNPERNKMCFKIYECFFCKLKFAGKKTLNAHKCLITSVKCEKCEKYFIKIQSYNSHMIKMHGSLPISKHYCPLCKTVVHSTENQFKQHCRNCNRGNTNPIECEMCNKVFMSLKGYTIHKLFHDTRNYKTSMGVKIASNGLNTPSGKTICELCGKELVSLSGYRMHKRNVHSDTNEVYQCDTCSKLCKTKRSLFDHFRNSHKVDETPCTICGKVFRTKILLKKHMLYHDETKRIYKCNMCPEKAGWVTNVALKRHQRTHYGERPYTCDYCEAAYTAKHQLNKHISNRHRTAVLSIDKKS